MKIKDDTWNIVIVGNWNKYILSPEWSAKYIFENPKIHVEYALNLDLPPRFTSSNIRCIPSDDRVTFVALKTDNETLKHMESMAQKLIEKLSYTPITAFGVNFGFNEEIEKTDLLNLFTLTDIKNLSDFGCAIKNCSIKRELIIRDRFLKFKIVQIADKAFFDFNFHYPVKDASEVKDKIMGSIIENKEIAESLLKAVYNLEYDNLEE